MPRNQAQNQTSCRIHQSLQQTVYSEQLEPIQICSKDINSELLCHHCGSSNHVKSGKDPYGKQKHKCKDCGREFVENRINGIKNSNVSCHHCGSSSHAKAGKDPTGRQKYSCKDCGREFVENRKNFNYLHFSEDVWDARELGLRVNKSSERSKLVFIYIQQDWLKTAAKKFVKYMAATNKSIGTLRFYISSFNDFSKFISMQYPSITFDEINRSVILDYLNYISQEGLGWQRKRNRISCLKVFLETGVTNQWFNVPPYLIHFDDFPKGIKTLPRYIPEEVMQQLNQHLDALPEPVIRMVLVIQECGLRVGELLQLPINCLKQDVQGDWKIQFMRWKMLEEDILPISSDLAGVIQEQQQYIRQQLGEGFEYLFCARHTTGCNYSKNEFRPKPKVMHETSFINFLKNLAKEFDIRDCLGKPWNFQSHQFRHTVGTRMINNGVPQHIVQRYLGHKSPTMTMVYAHIHDETLKKEIAKYHETKVVNIAGEVVEVLSIPEEDNNLEWFKKTVLAQALPNGYCGRPKVLGTCNLTPNSCLGCAHFRTNKKFLDLHKDELSRTKKILEKAKAHGWEVQVSMNELVLNNLENIIKALESDDS